ncbi:MAG: DHHA1 domain-containing protein [Candidatus Pacebacteria bacterium]|jgi:nanoRNase/pAp phosphatase (c-di-AMP/oligoRNAs hydrolase)|nr:DHHA1 domain-containing protein [Candidatus Paceibacterota bacterium]
METELKDTVIIYHGDCPDGFGAAYAAWKKFGDTATYLPWKDHDALPPLLEQKEIYIVDFSFDAPLLKQLNDTNKSVVVIDHHVSAEADVRAYPQNIFDNNHSGCVLAWQYFHGDTPVPSVLAYVEDHDLWRFALIEHREFNVALHETPMTFEAWDALIEHLKIENNLINFIAKGSLLAKFEDKIVAKIFTYREKVLFEGIACYAINASRYYRSILGNMLAELNESEGGTALGIVYYRSNGAVNISLRSKGSVDVAAIAEKFGGGGHKNAASIRVDNFRDLPFDFLS